MITLLRHLLSLALIVAVVAPPARAQSGPEAVAQAYGTAVTTADWAGAARLMHPDALKQLRMLFEPLVTAPGMGELGAEVFGVSSAAEFAATPDTVLFASLLRAVTAQQPGLVEALRTASMTPLGHVAVRGDTAFVVSRLNMTIEGVELTQFEVMPFVKSNGRWMGLLKADFTNMAAMLRKAIGPRPS